MATNLSERLAEAKGAPIRLGEVEVRAIYELRFIDETALNVTFQQFRKDRAQALRLKAEGGILVANGLTLRDAAFWTDTAPQTFRVSFQPKHDGGVVKMWNEWRDDSGTEHAWIGNAGMVVTVDADRTISLKCSDGIGVPSFDDLVVTIGCEVAPRVVDFAAHRRTSKR